MDRIAFLDKPFVAAAFVLGVGLLLTGSVVSYTLYSIRGLDNTLSVTGSAKQDVTADTAKWSIEVSRTVQEGGISGAYAAVAQDATVVKKYFADAGISSTTETTTFVDQNYTNNGPTTYRVHETITVESSDVNKIDALSHTIGQLANRGVQVEARMPEYYVSNLPELRVALLGQAVADAKARAEQIAKSGGASVGSLKSAASGVVQVLAPNSTNVEDYGSYDTSSIQKEVMVTARATFLVR
ncbi:MAG: hypothetical protein JWO43_31 [Candidatus Adlerbacteria bacterium]|nr:hypothetical protein [Candidatus Adlerbacteria bacterium]